MQTIEVNLIHIPFISGIELHSKIRNGDRTFLLSGRDIEKIITQYSDKIKSLEIELKNERQKNKTEVKPNEPHRVETTTRLRTGSYGD